MIALRTIFRHRLPLPTLTTTSLASSSSSSPLPPKSQASPKKKSIQQQLLQLSDTIPPASPNSPDYSQIASNYIQFEEQSFVEYCKEHQNDPQMMLMFLSTFQDPRQVAEYLPFLYPHSHLFPGPQLLLLLQKVLAFTPKQKPKLPYPRDLSGIESILVILGELYPADQLLDWMKLVPLYQGDQYYVLFMGYFSILAKMSDQLKARNTPIWVKCHEKLVAVLQDPNEPVESVVGIISLAFELSYRQAPLLLLVTPLQYKTLDPLKATLLFLNITTYMQNPPPTPPTNTPTQSLSSLLKKQTNLLASHLQTLDFTTFMKVQLMVQMWALLGSLKELNGVFVSLLGKMLALMSDKQFRGRIAELKVNELLVVFQAMQKHKVNSQKTVKMMLVLFSPHLNNMPKKQLIRVLKCLVTYVRQCEDYLISTRQILESRKFEFTPEQIVQINEILRRVEILFPTKFGK